ncbi:MAG TPA: HIT domain-containing protein [Candidatus Saccharimonadales bacterium]|nr:HIT domain-containing protein [Candidatus Saccharimonadales bacterium]
MIKKTKWLLKEARLRVSYMMSKDCIFCKIVSGEIKSKPVFETDSVLAIVDINPIASVHILIMPKVHIDSVLTISKDDGGVIIEMFDVAKKLVEKEKLKAFRIAFNGGVYQHVPHLHMHLVAGKTIHWSKL